MNFVEFCDAADHGNPVAWQGHKASYHCHLISSLQV